jgi:hypothetical protein
MIWLIGLDDFLGLGDSGVDFGFVLGHVVGGLVVSLDDDLGAVGDLALEDHLAHRVFRLGYVLQELELSLHLARLEQLKDEHETVDHLAYGCLLARVDDS